MGRTPKHPNTIAIELGLPKFKNKSIMNKPMTIETDDFNTIIRLAQSGELTSLSIDWINTILHWNFFYQATFIFKP